MDLFTTRPLPESYRDVPPAEALERIAALKKDFGRRVCILAHHYQRDAIVAFGDFLGDSLKLARLAAEQDDAEYIVFCGVRFMAESADILSAPEQTVLLPNAGADCPMAGMADSNDLERATDELAQRSDRRIVPITYVNSPAAAKAITGRHGGACCTSSNAANVVRWAFDPDGGAAEAILFVPDQHLGRNTAEAMGYADACRLYDPAQPGGGLSDADLAAARFLLWKGHCYVHQQFRPEHVEMVRRRYPEINVIVHPECDREVVARADAAGSTEQIIRAIDESAPGSQWAIGTESHLVGRLAAQYPDRRICSLSSAPPVCIQMQKIDPPHLLWALESIAEGSPANVVRVPDEVASDAKLALQRMLDAGRTP